ncbi:elastase-1-like [Mytilus galloprovincialis]|uniref:elastase-1-like n=1 Tax=Mytilus galloprovincialis TaxID=29158 RepID=UPI003F7C3822
MFRLVIVMSLCLFIGNSTAGKKSKILDSLKVEGGKEKSRVPDSLIVEGGEKNKVPDSLMVGNGGKTRVPDSFIVGGRDASLSSWPWQVGLISAYGVFCGGTLITYDVVITAAHCLDGSRRRGLSVVVGEYNRYFWEGYEQYIPVKSFNVHPNYDNNFLKGYDIAILFLERNATPSYRVKPIPGIAHKTLYYTKCKCFITGWGIKSMVRLPSAASKNIESKTDGYGHLAVTLQEAEIEVISNSKCNSRRYWDGLVKPTNICAFHKKTAACEGDSGGPLVCKVQNQYILVGVTSWGSSSCMSYPTVFADIAKFWEWTQDRILQYRMLVREIKTDDTKLEMEMNIFQEK